MKRTRKRKKTRWVTNLKNNKLLIICKKLQNGKERVFEWTTTNFDVPAIYQIRTDLAEVLWLKDEIAPTFIVYFLLSFMFGPRVKLSGRNWCLSPAQAHWPSANHKLSPVMYNAVLEHSKRLESGSGAIWGCFLVNGKWMKWPFIACITIGA